MKSYNSAERQRELRERERERELRECRHAEDEATCDSPRGFHCATMTRCNLAVRKPHWPAAWAAGNKDASSSSTPSRYTARQSARQAAQLSRATDSTRALSVTRLISSPAPHTQSLSAIIPIRPRPPPSSRETPQKVAAAARRRRKRSR